MHIPTTTNDEVLRFRRLPASSPANREKNTVERTEWIRKRHCDLYKRLCVSFLFLFFLLQKRKRDVRCAV